MAKAQTEWYVVLTAGMYAREEALLPIYAARAANWCSCAAGSNTVFLCLLLLPLFFFFFFYALDPL